MVCPGFYIEIVHHPATGARATGGDHHRGMAALGPRLRQIADHALMILMAVDGHQLLEGQRMPAGLEPGLGLLVPIPAQAPIAGREVGRQRGVEDDLQRAPGGACAGPQQARSAAVCG
mgnify:CR=1 FL=1